MHVRSWTLSQSTRSSSPGYAFDTTYICHCRTWPFSRKAVLAAGALLLDGEDVCRALVEGVTGEHRAGTPAPSLHND